VNFLPSAVEQIGVKSFNDFSKWRNFVLQMTVWKPVKIGCFADLFRDFRALQWS